MFNYKQFFDPRYLFVSPLSRFSSLYLKLILFLVFILLVGGIIILIWRKANQKRLTRLVLDRVISFSFVLGLTGLFLFFARQENIALFNFRFWWIIYFVGGLIWLLFIIHYWIVVLPQERKKQLTKGKFEQYLPQSKK